MAQVNCVSVKQAVIYISITFDMKPHMMVESRYINAVCISIGVSRNLKARLHLFEKRRRQYQASKLSVQFLPICSQFCNHIANEMIALSFQVLFAIRNAKSKGSKQKKNDKVGQLLNVCKLRISLHFTCLEYSDKIYDFIRQNN